MKIIADLHVHGRFARATSKALTIQNLEKWGRIKGLNLIGTGDFTHPEWFKEIKHELPEERDGIYYTKTGFPFMLQTEISLVYTQDGKGRRMHLIVLAPSLGVVGQITEYLLTFGRVDYDGRPIFKITCDRFVAAMKNISPKIEVIPAHIWTPWFSLFGSKSGFNSVEECFKDQAKHIHAMETGLSSDPAMNWRLSSLDKYSLISNSDTHSFWPWKLGRECNIFELKKLTYDSVIELFKTKKGFVETIEFFPEEGKYHFDGHRKCGILYNPGESQKVNNICPVCGKPLTLGVLHRVEELADRPVGFKPKGAVPFRNLIPLSEIIAGGIGCPVASPKMWRIYNPLLEKFENEMNILLETPIDDIKKITGERIAELIAKNRNQEMDFQPGFDGEYGRPIFNAGDKQLFKEQLQKKALRPVQTGVRLAVKKQKSLFDF